MGKKSRSRDADTPASRLDQEIAAVLGEQEHPEVRELLRLIHAVNPTGYDFTPGHARHRYDQKSALQSLLIRRFGDDVVVERTESERIIGLRYRLLDLDAAHAALDELDEDARAWVRLQLDLQESGGSAAPRPRSSPRPAPEVDPTSPLFLGRAALEAYDYPVAREHFERALRETAGSPEAAVPLLELLVDTLAADAEALALEPRLDATSRRHAVVRGLLALAAARSGEGARALALSDGADAHAAEAMAALGRRAIEAGEIDGVGAWLSRLEELDPSHPELVPLRDGLVRVRARAREPLERELTEALARGEHEAAEALAQRILASWSESAVARRATEELAARARRARAEALLAKAEQAQAERDLQRAISLLREAHQLLPELKGLLPRIDALVIEARSLAEVEAVAAVESELRRDASSGLTSWLELTGALRSRVDAGLQRVARERLDHLKPERSQAEATIRAVLALEELEASSLKGPSAALSWLAPHRAILERLPEARPRFAALEAELGEQRRRRLEELVIEAERAAEGGEAGRARALLAEAGPSERAQALLARLDARDELERLRSAQLRAEAEANWLEARDLAETLSERDAEEERLSWRSRRADLDAKVRAAWRLEVDELGEHGAPLSQRPEGPPQLDATERLLPAGRGPLLVQVLHRWVFVEELDVATQRTRRQLRLQLPEPSRYTFTEVSGGSLWLTTTEGWLLELDDAGVRRWQSLRALLGSHHQIDDACLAPGERYLWVGSNARSNGKEEVWVIDLSSQRIARTFGEAMIRAVPGTDEPAMLLADFDRGGSLHAPSGAPLRAALSLPADLEFAAAASHPLEGTPVFVVAPPAEDKPGEHQLDPEPLRPLGLLLNPKQKPRWIEDSEADLISSLAVSRDDGLLFGTSCINNTRSLIAWSATGDELYRLPIPNRAGLFQEEAGRWVALVSRTATGVVALRLGRNAPTIPPLPGERPAQPSWEPPFYCYPKVKPPPDNWEQQEEREDWEHIELGQEPTATNLENLFRKVAKADLGRKVLGYYNSLRELESPAAAETLESLQKQKDTEPVVRLFFAHEALDEGRWTEAEADLEGLDIKKLEAAEVRHLRHLQGLFKFRAGDLAGAVKLWKMGCAVHGEDQCHLAEPLAIAEALLAHQKGKALKHPLVAALIAGEALLSKGDARGAFAALDVPEVHDSKELQSRARLAASLLQVEATTPVERFRKAALLAGWIHLRRKDHLLGKPLSLPITSRWDEARLKEVELQAEAWLTSEPPR